MKKLILPSFILATLLLTPNFNNASIDYGQIEKILIYKEDRKLLLVDEFGRIAKNYKVSLGKQPKGHKIMEGDNKTPEGSYTIEWRNKKSKYYKSLKISYPDEQDKKLAEAMGVQVGSNIMIHGLPNESPFFGWIKHTFNKAWTAGCIALTNSEMDEIWKLVPDGTDVIIRP